MNGFDIYDGYYQVAENCNCLLNNWNLLNFFFLHYDINVFPIVWYLKDLFFLNFPGALSRQR